MLQETKEIREQTPEQSREQQSVVKAQAPQPEANDVIALAVLNAFPSAVSFTKRRQSLENNGILDSSTVTSKYGSHSATENRCNSVIL